MSKAFHSIRQGLEEAVKHATNQGGVARMHKPRPVNVKAVRVKTGMTQVQFAALFGFGLGTLRHWERGDRTPRGPSLVLLNVIAKEPMTVLRSLDV
jgi:putative transcriptional regulator